MSEKRWFRVADEAALADWAAAPDVYVVRWEQRYPGTAILSAEESVEFSDRSTAHGFAEQLRTLDHVVADSIFVEVEKPAKLRERATRQAITQMEAIEELARSAKGDPLPNGGWTPPSAEPRCQDACPGLIQKLGDRDFMVFRDGIIVLKDVRCMMRHPDGKCMVQTYQGDNLEFQS